MREKDYCFFINMYDLSFSVQTGYKLFLVCFLIKENGSIEHLNLTNDFKD